MTGLRKKVRLMRIQKKGRKMRGLIDIHCHVVPGVDDGAKTLYDSGKILQQEYFDEVSAIIATPHYRRGMFETPQEEVERQFNRLHEMASRSRSGMKVYLGCEYHSGFSMVRDIRKGLRPTMAGSRYVLTEFSSRHSYTVIRNQIYDLVAAGYKPIIAHAERYPCLVSDHTRTVELVRAGARIQLTSGNVLGEMGKPVKKYCHYLLKNGLVSFIATDAHDIKERRPNLGKCADYVEKKYGKDYAADIFIHNPQLIINEGEAAKRRKKRNEKSDVIEEKAAL